MSEKLPFSGLLTALCFSFLFFLMGTQVGESGCRLVWLWVSWASTETFVGCCMESKSDLELDLCHLAWMIAP